jgi:uncharacterized protein YjiK
VKNCVSIISVSIILILSACKTGPGNIEKLTGYNLKSPDISLFLPNVLHEISGLTYIDSTKFACIQDEKGVLYIYDFAAEKIKKQFTFFSKGDYEGIARVEDTIYVLRSDGTLFEISDYKSGNVIVVPYPTYIPIKDNEGLCYDKENNRLLITGKENIAKGGDLKDLRFIYGFDLKTKLVSKEPVYTFNIQSMKEFAINNSVGLPLKKKKKKNKLSVEPILLFRPSAICIHPVTGDLLIISSEDHLMLAFNKSGNIDQMVKLDPALFSQPEGITFLLNGDMLISNEGQGKGPATLLKFKYHPK